MSAAWIAYAALVGALLALVAYATEGIARQLRLPARWGWIASLLLTVTLIAISVSDARSPSPAAIDAPTVTAATASVSVAPNALTSMLDAIARGSSAMRGLVAGVARSLPSGVGRALALLWLGASGAALTLLAFVQLRLRLARRRWPVTRLHGQRVRVTPDTGPAVIGVIAPEILVPRWLLQRPEHEQRVVLAHEREHLRGGDHVALIAGCVAVALLPWHPALWWMFGRLRLAIELDCDARVLRRGLSVSAYGTTLIDLAGQCSGFRVGATALADEGSHLERRILAMNTSHRRSIIRAGVLGAAGALALLAACEARVPTAAEIGAMDAATAQRNAQMFGAWHDAGKVQFYVDGKLTDARAAHALAPNQIATVSVTHGATASEPTTIRITTSGETASASSGGGALARLHNTLARVVGMPQHERMHASASNDHQMMSGLIVVNGSVVDAATFAKLDPATLKSVEVVKGPLATKLYDDPRAANGVIRITTR